eukprot:gene3982-4235_t
MLARTYLPSHMAEPVKDWKKDLASVNPKAADALADPQEYPNLFPGLQEAILQEASAAAAQASISRHPAAAYASLAATGVLADDLAEQLAVLGINNSSGEAVEHTWVTGAALDLDDDWGLEDD